MSKNNIILKNNPKNSLKYEDVFLNSWCKSNHKTTKMKQELNNSTQTETKLTFKAYKYHTENPFISEVIEHISDKRYRKAVGCTYQQVLNEESGELENQKIFVLGEQKKVDKQEYYKVFYGAIKNFFQLSKSTMTLFEYIMTNICYSHDRICILSGDVKEKIGMSRSGCYRGILQLLEAGVIAKADQEGCYFINPTIAFKGDRITLIKQYILNKEKEKPVIERTGKAE